MLDSSNSSYPHQYSNIKPLINLTTNLIVSEYNETYFPIDENQEIKYPLKQNLDESFCIEEGAFAQPSQFKRQNNSSSNSNSPQIQQQSKIVRSAYKEPQQQQAQQQEEKPSQIKKIENFVSQSQIKSQFESKIIILIKGQYFLKFGQNGGLFSSSKRFIHITQDLKYIVVRNSDLKIRKFYNTNLIINSVPGHALDKFNNFTDQERQKCFSIILKIRKIDLKGDQVEQVNQFNAVQTTLQRKSQDELQIIKNNFHKSLSIINQIMN